MRFSFACVCLVGLLACNGKIEVTNSTNPDGIDASADQPDATIARDAGEMSVDAGASSTPDADAPTPVPPHPRFVAVDATRVYWTDASGAAGLGWASKDGSSSGTYALPGCGTIAGLSVSTFINVACAPTSVRIAKDGSDPQLRSVGYSGTADGAGHAFLGFDIGIFEEDTIGVGFLITSSTTHAYAVAADPTNLFWSEFLAQNASDPCATSAAGIMMMVAGSGMHTQVAPARVPPFGLATSGGVLVWTDTCAHTVSKLASGGAAAVLATNLDGAIAVDSTYAYVLGDGMSPGVKTLSSVSLAMGTVKPIMDIPGGGANLALDDTTIYVGGAAAVVRIPKPN